MYIYVPKKVARFEIDEGTVFLMAPICALWWPVYNMIPKTKSM